MLFETILGTWKRLIFYHFDFKKINSIDLKQFGMFFTTDIQNFSVLILCSLSWCISYLIISVFSYVFSWTVFGQTHKTFPCLKQNMNFLFSLFSFQNFFHIQCINLFLNKNKVFIYWTEKKAIEYKLVTFQPKFRSLKWNF